MIGNYPPSTKVAFIGTRGLTIVKGGETPKPAATAASDVKSTDSSGDSGQCSACAEKAAKAEKASE